MHVERFIANRLRGSDNVGSFSQIIVRIAIISVALSISVMITASSMIYGFKKQISQKIFDFWGHIQVTEAFTNPILETSPIVFPEGIVDSLVSIQRVTYEWPMAIFGFELQQSRTRRTRGGVKSAFPYVQYPAAITTKEDMEGILIKGIASHYPRDFFDQYLIGGSLSEADSTHRTLVISQMTADRLLLEVGDRILVHFIRNGNPYPRRFTVSGIYKTGLAEYDEKVAFAHMNTLQDVLGWQGDDVSGIEIVLDDIRDLDILNYYIYQEVLPPEIYTRTIKQRAASIFDWLELQNINEVLILGLMLLVCVINMITALLILILERTHMIGVLKSLGANNWQVRRIFIRQATNILVRGLLWGNGVGILLCMAQKHLEFIKLREEDYYLSVAPIDFNLPMILAINLGTLLLTILCLILPSYFVSRISPTKAIRFS